jgi:hypothetical protein
MGRDARSYLGGDLNRGVLLTMGREYRGEVKAVAEEDLYDRWKGTQNALVVYFADGYRRILSRANVMALIEELGHDWDGWTGAHLRLFVERGEMVMVQAIEPPAKTNRNQLTHPREP